MKGSKVTGTNLVKLIAGQSDRLTIDNVNECFEKLGDIVMSLMESEYIPDDTEIVIPHLGRIKLRKVKGKKIGDKGFSKKYQEYYLYAYDTPDTTHPFFAFSKTIKQARKEASKKKWYREHGGEQKKWQSV